MPDQSSNKLPLFAAVWGGLTLVTGALVFGLVYWAMGGFESRAAAPLPTQAPIVVTQPLPTPLPPTPVPQAANKTCTYPAPPASGFGYGIQSHVYFGEGDFDVWMGMINDLGMQWVKIQARWEDLEPEKGQYNWFFLDGVLDEACKRGIHVMLSVVAAPEWTKANPLPPEKGAAPPDDIQLYAEFLGKLIDQYPGKIGAIEVWNEQNLEREWNTAEGVNPAAYIKLLQAAHATIKQRDPNLIVISGALSPTGINCKGEFPNCTPEGRTIVVDDVTYLRQFIEGGGLQYADCIGTHSNGTNLPPTADGNNPPADKTGYTFMGPWNNPHYSWSLKSQIEAYAKMLNGQKRQCVTEFGYASPMDGKFRPGFEFAADVTEEKQAKYLVDAFNWMRDSGQVQMAFLFNLDYGPKGGDAAEDDNVIFSIIHKSSIPRPAFMALQQMPKP